MEGHYCLCLPECNLLARQRNPWVCIPLSAFFEHWHWHWQRIKEQTVADRKSVEFTGHDGTPHMLLQLPLLTAAAAGIGPVFRLIWKNSTRHGNFNRECTLPTL